MASPGAIKAGEAFVELNADDSQFTAKLNRVPGKLARAARAVNQINSSVQQIGGTALVAGFAMAPVVTTFIGFDDAALAMKAATETTGEAFEQLRNHALHLGRTTSYTATEVANLMTELGRAGFKPDQIQDMTKATLDLARATGADAVTATRIMSATIRQFSLDASQATRVADLLTATANKSFTNVTDLGEALKYSATAASDLGLSIEDTLALLGALGNAGIQGSEAGTALKRINVLAATGSKDLQRLFNVDGQDAAGRARPLIDVLDEITQSTKELGSAERAAKMNEFFGLLGLTSASVLGKTAVSVRELRDEIAKADGIAATTAAEMDSGLGGSWRRLKSGAEGAAIAIGSVLGPALGAAAKAIEVISSRVTEWVGENRELATRIGAAVVALLALGAAAIAIALIAKLVFVAVAGVKILAAVIALLFNPITWIAAAIGVLTYRWLKFTESGQRTAASLADLFNRLGETLGAVFDGLIVTLGKGDLASAWKVATLGLESIWYDLVSSLLDGWHHFTNLFRDAWRDLLEWVKVAWVKLQAYLETKFLVVIEGIILPALEASDAIGVTTGKAQEAQKVIDARKAAVERDKKEGIGGTNKEMEDAKNATIAQQAAQRKEYRDAAEILRSQIREITKRASVPEAPMPHEPGRDNLAPMPHSPRGANLERLGDSVRGVFQSGDYQGALGISAASDYAKQQLSETKNVVSILLEIRDKIEPGVFT